MSQKKCVPHLESKKIIHSYLDITIIEKIEVFFFLDYFWPNDNPDRSVATKKNG